jgi:hypothetical protein
MNSTTFAPIKKDMNVSNKKNITTIYELALEWVTFNRVTLLLRFLLS